MLIIASGSKHRQLDVFNEDKYVGKSLSYCAVCDGAFYAGRDVMVIGGGNSSLQEAVMLSEICSHVTIIQNLAYLTGEEVLAKKLMSTANVDVVYNCVVEALDGEDFLDAVILHDVSTGESKLLDTEGVFVAIGQQPDNGAFAEVVELDASGYIVAGEDCMCSTPGVFAAGDCRTKRVRQITTATGDGATAAVGACRYLDSL